MTLYSFTERVVRDRRSGMSLREVALKHGISRASMCRLVKESVAMPHVMSEAA